MPNFLFNKSQIWLGIVHMRVSPRRFNSFNRRWLEQGASGLPADQWLFTVDRGKQPKGRPKKNHDEVKVQKHVLLILLFALSSSSAGASIAAVFTAYVHGDRTDCLTCQKSS